MNRMKKVLALLVVVLSICTVGSGSLMKARMEREFAIGRATKVSLCRRRHIPTADTFTCRDPHFLPRRAPGSESSPRGLLIRIALWPGWAAGAHADRSSD